MKKLIVNSIIKSIQEYYNYDEIKIAEIRYGLETLYLTITKTIILVLISIIFGYAYELLYFMLFYGILRLTGFGLHAKKSIHCWISSFILFIGIPLICKYVTFSLVLKTIISVCAFIILCIYAPADTEKRPLIHKNKRIRYKVLTIIISLIYLFFIYYLESQLFINVLMFALVNEALMVNPLSYKLMGVPFDNYKNYKGKSKNKKGEIK